MVQYLNLKRINEKYHADFTKSFQDVLNSGWYILGEQLQNFESEFAKYNGVKHCLGVANGLDALVLSLKAAIELGQLKPQDEILVPANTYIASIMGIILAGLKPVLVEPNLDSFNIDPLQAKKAITKNTKGVMVVHLYGRLGPMDELVSLCREHGLLLFEDAAQSQGAERGGRKAGSFGVANGFSFYPGKNLGALGDAGAITTNDDQYFEVIKALRNYGSHKKYVNQYIGMNSRLDEMQAAFLRHKLKRLDEENAIREKIADTYENEISNTLLVKPKQDVKKAHVWHCYTVMVPNREGFMKHMASKQVGTLIHYPIPPHHQEGYKDILKGASLPLTEKIHQQIVSIPLEPTMTQPEISEVIAAVNSFKD